MDTWIIVVVVGVAALETVLSLTWNRLYFSTGIPICREDVVVGQPGSAPPLAGRLEDLLARSVFPPIAFRPLGGNLLGFRERGWSRSLRLHYTPVMHGTLWFEPTGARLHVIGRANWFTITFLAVGIAASFSFQAPLFFVLLVGLSVGIYAIQAKRFREVARAAAQEWDRAKATL